MIKRPTWILLVILVLAVGAYFFIENRPSKINASTPTATAGSFLITQAQGVLQSLHIADNKGDTFQMQRDLSKAWVVTAPSSGPADQGLAGAAETQVGALSIVTTLNTPPTLSDIGLAVPADTIDLVFVNGTSHTMEIGNLTPTSSGYYVRFDGGKIYVIEKSGIDSLLNLLTNPPFPPTPTSPPTPETTGTPTSGISTPTP
jgi:hypothetical protein